MIEIIIKGEGRWIEWEITGKFDCSLIIVVPTRKTKKGTKWTNK